MSVNYDKLISAGILEKMKSGETLSFNPVLQVIGVKCVPANPNNPESVNRYRMIVNDGIATHSFVMLATTLNPLYESGELDENCIFSVERFVPSKVNRDGPNDRNVLIVFEVKVLHKGEEVGRVIKLSGSSGGNNSAAKENLNGNTPAYKPHDKKEYNYGTVGESFYDLTSHLTMPIESLSPYQNKWVIKARVTAKSQIRTWNNAKGEGKLFSFDLLDETGEIRVTAFRDMVDKYYDMLEIDKVYYISKCQIKPANKQYSKLKNDYEMTIGSESIIQLCNEDADGIPKLRFDLIKIAEIAEKEPDSIVDVIGICKEVSDCATLIAKSTGRELTKRELTLVDNSNASITLTIWGEDAVNFHAMGNPVVLLKGASVKEYQGGKTLGTVSGTTMKINPDIPEGHQIRGWFENQGSSAQFSTLSTKAAGGGISTEWMTFHDMKEKHLGSGDKPDYLQMVGMIHNIRQNNMLYKACPRDECNKKVTDNGDGMYRCEKCNVEGPEFKNRLLTNVLVGDWTSNRWVTLFAEGAETVLGKNGDEVAALLEGDSKEAEAYFHERQFKPMMFKLRTKIETYGDVPRPKTTAVSVSTQIPYKEYNAMLLNNIYRLSGINKVE